MRLSYARLRAFGFTPRQAHALVAAGFTITFVPIETLVGVK